MSHLYFVQMSGAPGSGKTTVATAVAPHLKAVILDHDVTKTALLDSGIALSESGKGSYAVIKALVSTFLAQGHNIILDSPCFYEELLTFGLEVAEKYGAQYRYIECVTNDLTILDARLKMRPTLRSQVRSIKQPPIDIINESYRGEAVFERWIAEMKRPLTHYLQLDTTRPVAVCVNEAVSFC
ncbi:MAG: ATP-binding protein, partial [Chloroflexota bacterium]